MTPRSACVSIIGLCSLFCLATLNVAAATVADSEILAQGFVVAQDRLFQMELWKRSGQGRLAEVLGPFPLVYSKEAVDRNTTDTLQLSPMPAH